MNRIELILTITCPSSEIEKQSSDITLEQTVEVPATLVHSSDILENVVGKVESIEPVEEQQDAFLVMISYNADLSAYQLPQLLNLLYGNISIKNNIRLIDIDLPSSLQNMYLMVNQMHPT